MNKLLAKTDRRATIGDMATGPEQFREWMRKRGFTQADSARYLGWPEPYLSKMLSGQTPRLKNAIKIERLTGIPVEAWLSSSVDDDDESVSVALQKPKLHKR